MAILKVLMYERWAILRITGQGWIAIDYLLQGFYKNTLRKYQQMATMQTIRQFWHLVKHTGITMELYNQQLHTSGNSMLFFWVVVMRSMQEMQPHKIKLTRPGNDKQELITGAFNMDDAEQLAALMPDEILLPYRKNRSYINSILASNEISRWEQPGCKPAFQRVQRGWYILNPDIKWQTSLQAF